jgi:chaperone modulatory protein CbpM
VIEMVDEGLVEPAGAGPEDWRFRGPALQRVQTALRLSHDLRVNLAGAALALELMDERDDLRRQLRNLRDRTEPDVERLAAEASLR